MPDNPIPQQLPNQDNSTDQTSIATLIISSLRTQAITWLVGFLIAILTIFSSKITESIKFAINSADHNSKNYEELAVDLSDFVFRAELIAELVGNGWTTSEALIPAINEYNASVVVLRKKEFVYLSWIKRNWRKDIVDEGIKVFDAVKAFDKAIHSLNDEFEAVNIKKTKSKVDTEKAIQAERTFRPALKHLQQESSHFLSRLVE